jgi:hypothetical protein
MFSFRRTLKRTLAPARLALAPAMLMIAAGFTGAVHAADADPTMNQVYDAASSGHLAEAQQMMNQVLRDHPQSAKAHYVAAEIDARARSFAAARQELSTAETLAPGLPFAPAGAVAALRSELSQSGPRYAVVPGAPARPAFPWVPVLLIGGGILIAWTYLRRRAQQAMLQSPYAHGPGYPGGYPAPGYPGGVPMGGAPMGGPVAFPGVAGGGSGIVGGLASGLAVGAGLAAGEELIHHVFDGDRAAGGVVPEQREYVEPPVDPNANMGGNDFGLSNSSSWDDNSGGSGGGSWDDGGGSGGGGGDWT